MYGRTADSIVLLHHVSLKPKESKDKTDPLSNYLGMQLL